MRKLTTLFFIALLSSAMAVAQSTSTAPQSGSQSGAAQTQATPPAATRNAPSNPNSANVPRNPDTAAPNPQNSGSSAASTNASGTTPTPQQQTPGAAPAATQRTAGNSSGVPWGWIIVGIVVIAIILALIGRGSSDRVVRRDEFVERDRTAGPTVVTRERRDDDDIRRVG